MSAPFFVESNWLRCLVKPFIRESEKLSGKVPEYRLLNGAELLLTIFAADMPDNGELFSTLMGVMGG